jgi:hypothetical protein
MQQAIAKLALEDGTVYTGKSVGATGESSTTKSSCPI